MRKPTVCGGRPIIETGTGPLAGLRVLDFGQYVAGPLTAVLLADQGADVIHVDPPGGPRWAGVADAFFNRGKRRVILDLKQPEDLAAARRLAGEADVVIENFRPGVLDRLGLDLDAARRARPALITCSLPGFGASDPRAGMRGYEGVIAAATANWAAAQRGGTARLGLGAADLLGAAVRL